MRKKYLVGLVVIATAFHTQLISPPINLSIAKDNVERYYESGEYDKDLNKIIAKAKKRFKKIPVKKNSLVIFDVDDTALSDYADSKSIDFGYIPKLSTKWVLRADAPGISQTKELYDLIVKLRFKIIFLTGRKYYEHEATIKNLKRQGFTTFDRLIVRQPDELKLKAQEYKTNRRKQLTEEGYNIVGNIGDQESDLQGPHSGYRVKLPNYRYLIP